MPNGYDDTDDLGQDYREPPIVAPPVVAAARPVVTAPSSPAVAPPVPASPFLSAADAAQQASMRRLQYQVANLPLSEAEQAVSTALKFQAIRGYQKDLQAGISAPEALTKWAPIMFSQPKAGTLGQAASLVRAGTPAEKYMDIGGVGYQMKAGKAIPLTPPKPAPVKPITLTSPTDPGDPFGPRVTVPLDREDPLVKQTLERARRGPEPTPEAPSLFERVFGRRTPAAPAAPAPGMITPPAVTPAPAPAPAAPRPRTAQEKLDAARALRKQHPDWTKQRILDEVNR